MIAVMRLEMFGPKGWVGSCYYSHAGYETWIGWTSHPAKHPCGAMPGVAWARRAEAKAAVARMYGDPGDEDGR